uniref:Uncharacterized protein n=1 Tax=Ciona intestinalis TaxID=7719 RepID=H2XJQ8_CIOIN
MYPDVFVPLRSKDIYLLLCRIAVCGLESLLIPAYILNGANGIPLSFKQKFSATPHTANPDISVLN